MNDEKLSNYLSKCKYFSALSSDEMDRLIINVSIVNLKQGDFLFKKDSIVDHLYLLVEGELISFVVKSDGSKIVIGSIHPIETVGELGVLSGEPRSLSISAVHDSILLQIPGDVFKELCSREPSVLSALSSLIIERSLKTIKIVTHEKPSYYVTILLPLTKLLPISTLKFKIKQSIESLKYLFIDSSHTSFNEIKHVVHTRANQGHPIFIFFDQWNDEILNLSPDKAMRLYFLVNHHDEYDLSKDTNRIMHSIKAHPNLRIELIFLYENNTKKITNTKRFLSLTQYHLHHHLRYNNESDFKRLIRFMTGNAYALVLGGGGARGSMHIGVIKAILDKGIPIDAIGGSSIGAIFAACYSATLNYIDCEKYAQRFKNAAIKSVSLSGLTWPIISIYSGTAIDEMLLELFESIQIEDLIIPYFSISTNFAKKNEVIHKSSFLYHATRASLSLPGIYPPFLLGDQMLLDGGLLNNLPVNRMREIIGPDHIIMASSVSNFGEKNEIYNFPTNITPWNGFLSYFNIGNKQLHYPPFFETFLDALLIGSSSEEFKNCEEADILIRPQLPIVNLLRLDKKTENKLAQIGYDETIASIEKFFKHSI